jgi:SagB-type dehydrogenase family enzyme
MSVADDAVLRRAFCLIGYWDHDGFTLENYVSGRQTLVAPLVAQWLASLGSDTSYPEVILRLGPIPNAASLVQRLVDQDVLLVTGTPVERQDRLVQETWKWDHSARFLHYRTRRMTYQTDPAAEFAELAELARREPAPSPFKDYGQPEVPLPTKVGDRSGGLWDVLRARRTRRRFLPEPIPVAQLATVLLWTWGATQTVVDPEVGPFVLKTSPSGGARHPVEVYPVVLRVDGVEPGIYHYSVRRHGLERLRAGHFEELAVGFCAEQRWVGDAAVVCVLTAVLERSMWKYRQAHAYRVLLLDAGHLGQTFHLVCTALGLAPFTSAAMRDEMIERELGLDGASEVPIYTAAFGRPA